MTSTASEWVTDSQIPICSPGTFRSEEFLNVYGQVETELTAQNLISLPLWDDEHGIRMGDGLTDPDMLAGYVPIGRISKCVWSGRDRVDGSEPDQPAPVG